MNAVAAVFGAAPDSASRLVDLMLARMPARADGRRVVVSGPAAMIAASGRSPAFSDRPGVAALAGDVRLADGCALRRDLGIARETSDAATLLEAFGRRGEGFARELTGEFAFTILDRRANRLIAVRDHLGVRPLFYRRGASDVRIASELAALVEPGDRPDEGFLAEFLAGQLVDAGATPYAAVRRVPPAHVLIADDDGVRLVRYWDPPAEPLRESRAAHAERLRAGLDEAVRSCCAGETRVGVHLSGGLDSSSVVATVMATAAAEPVAASIVFPWPEADERPWIAEVARHWDLRPLLVDAPRPSPHGLADIRIHRDLPDLPHGFPMFAAMTAALRAESIQVVLTGLGGDQWWTGDMAHMSDLVRRLDIGALRTWAAAGPAMGELEWGRGDLWTHALRPLVPAPLRRLVSDIRQSHVPAWIDPSFAARVALQDRLRRRPDTRDAPSEAWRRLRWRLDCADESASHERMDRLGVRFGMEMRHPLYDRRLIELAFSIPDSSRIAGGRARVVLREAMAPRLPRAIVDRTSKGDVSQVWIEAARSPDLAPYLDVPVLTGLGWVRPRIVADIVERTRERGDTTAAHAFWRIVSVEAWFHEVFGAR